MKKGWVTRTFEDCIEPVRYTRKIQRKDFLGDGLFPIVSQEAELTNGFWDDEDDVFKVSTPVIIFGDHTQILKYVDFDFVLGADGVKILQPSDFLLPRFFFYQLLAANIGTLGYARHYRLLKKLEIKIPPLAEQQRIVGLLDEAFEAIATAKANTEQNLQNARAIFESYLNEVFTKKGKGWVEKKLEDIGKTQTGSTPKTSVQSNYGDFISFVKPGDFNTNGTLDYCKDGLSESGAATTRIVAAGSVLMVCIGATIGKCGYCDQDVTTNQQVNALTPSDGSFNRFIYYQMLTESFQRKVILASGQATLPIINKSKWSALSIWLPLTVAEQKQIATRLDNLSTETQRLARLYERKHAALEELKKSLLNKAFSGEL